SVRFNVFDLGPAGFAADSFLKVQQDGFASLCSQIKGAPISRWKRKAGCLCPWTRVSYLKRILACLTGSTGLVIEEEDHGEPDDCDPNDHGDHHTRPYPTSLLDGSSCLGRHFLSRLLLGTCCFSAQLVPP